jgi:hypothetical protein
VVSDAEPIASAQEILCRNYTRFARLRWAGCVALACDRRLRVVRYESPRGSRTCRFGTTRSSAMAGRRRSSPGTDPSTVVPSESRFPERVRRPSRRRPGRPLDSPSRGRGPVAGATLVDVLLPIVHPRMGSSENTQTPLRFWRRRASRSSTTVAPRPDGGRPPRVRSHRRCIPRRFSPLVRGNPVDRAPDRAPSGEIVWPPVWHLTLCAAVGE